MKAPRNTVVQLKPSTRQLSQQQTIDTMRLLIAVMVRRYGVFDMVRLLPDEIVAAQSGELKVADEKDGAIVLRLERTRPKLAP